MQSSASSVGGVAGMQNSASLVGGFVGFAGFAALLTYISIRINQELSMLSHPISCMNVTGLSGLYDIQPDPNSPSFRVYCDMDTDGGGWTLVASVHENNINGKCTVGDKWSSEEGVGPGVSSQGSLSWENVDVFGRIEAITEKDYKNSAYFDVEASDVMIWHVPNGRKLNEINADAFLKYFTNSSFLEDNGGTLQNLFRNFTYSLPVEETGLFPLLRRINETVRMILQEVPSWYLYIYDDTYKINDGGNDLYDVGNIVSFRLGIDDEFIQLTYNQPYIFQSQGVAVQSAATYPFTALAWISESTSQFFEFQVQSDFGADGRGTASVYEWRSITQGDMRASYTAFLVPGESSQPSICEVYFYIGSVALWNTVFPTRSERINWTLSTSSADNIVRFSGKMSNLLLGYLLISRLNLLASPGQIENVLLRFMGLSETFQYRSQIQSLAVPVVYAKGDDSLILQSLPTSADIHAQPGFIQFRAVNMKTSTNALCPGVRVLSSNPARVCIGGGNSAAQNASICGDYAGWAGLPNQGGNLTSPSETGKSVSDITSTILIFIR